MALTSRGETGILRVKCPFKVYNSGAGISSLEVGLGYNLVLVIFRKTKNDFIHFFYIYIVVDV